MSGPRFDECTFAVIDVETTGIDAGRDRIIEVAILTCDWTGKVIDRFETLVRPVDGELTPARTEMLADAPTFAEVAGDVVTRLAGGVVAGHNVSFDLRFIDAELGRLGVRLPGHTYVCTRELATLLGCDVANRTLAALCVYFGVAFDRWHTAGDDTLATATVLAHLLARSAGYGRDALGAIGCRWTGIGVAWPALATGGRVLVRDPTRWPPKGDQPGSRRSKEASFRRLGAGPSSPSGASLVSDTDTDAPGVSATSDETADGVAEPQPSASERWWQGDFRGLAGITQLQDIVVPTFRANDDPELAGALIALADLVRRHGGRDGEVRATFAEAYAAAARRGDWDHVGVVVAQWWAYLGSLRDTEGQVGLLLQCLDTPDLGDPVERIRAQVASSRRDEPLVAQRLARQAMAALAERGDQPRAWEVLAILVQTLEYAGRADEAAALMEDAWATGCDAAVVLDRLSLRLEEAHEYQRAVDVCARALAHPPPAQAGLLAALKKRHRRCQERLARSATLFG